MVTKFILNMPFYTLIICDYKILSPLRKMELDEYVEHLKNIQSAFLSYIDDVENCEENYQNLVSLLDDQKIREKRNELELFLKLVIQISNDHYRTSNFFDKIDKILTLYKNEIKSNYTNFEIFSLFKSNKRLLLFLIEEKLMVIDKDIYNIMLNHTYTNLKYGLYFSPETRPFMIEEVNNDNYDFDEIESLHGFLLFMKPMFRDSMKKNPKPNLPDNFYQKRKIGENDEYICELIRNDSIEKFIIHVTRNSINLDDEFEPSIYETNSLLMSCGVTTLIEYAAFFGAIQIFKYLAKNGVELYPSLWNFAIHGNNPELISFLEESRLQIYNKSMFEINSDYDGYESDSETDENDSEKDENDTEKDENDTEKDENDTEKNENDTEKDENDTEKDENGTENDGSSNNNIDNLFDLMMEEEEDSYNIYDDDFDNNENPQDDEISDFNNSHEKILKEAIKCHHNDMANYIITNYIKKDKMDYYTDNKFGKSVDAYSFQYYNYVFFPKDLNQKFIIFYAAQHGYYEIVKNLLKNTNLKLMMKIVLLFLF